MSKAISRRERRTYFNNPLWDESLQFLAAAVDHPDSVSFRDYLIEHLPQSSRNTRERFAEYIAQRFSHDGVMNQDLARMLHHFGGTRVGMEVLYFEMLRAVPMLAEVAGLWLAERGEEGVGRQELLAFLSSRILDRSVDTIATAAIAVLRRARKITSPKLARYVPVWTPPPLEAFVYVLSRLYPGEDVVRFEDFAGLSVLRAMLWPRSSLEGLLREALRAGYVSRISQLDQYHQFALVGTGADRLDALLTQPDKYQLASDVGPAYGEPAARRPAGRGGKRRAGRRASAPAIVKEEEQLPLLSAEPVQGPA